MPTSATPAAVSPVRAVRRALDQLERALRPADAGLDDERPSPPPSGPADPDDELDSTTTSELLIPTGDEPHARRASRQAQAYLERRRRKLRRQLEDG